MITRDEIAMIVHRAVWEAVGLDMPPSGAALDRLDFIIADAILALLGGEATCAACTVDRQIKALNMNGGVSHKLHTCGIEDQCYCNTHRHRTADHPIVGCIVVDCCPSQT